MTPLFDQRSRRRPATSIARENSFRGTTAWRIPRRLRTRSTPSARAPVCAPGTASAYTQHRFGRGLHLVDLPAGLLRRPGARYDRPAWNPGNGGTGRSARFPVTIPKPASCVRSGRPRTTSRRRGMDQRAVSRRACARHRQARRHRQLCAVRGAAATWSDSGRGLAPDAGHDRAGAQSLGRTEHRLRAGERRVEGLVRSARFAPLQVADPSARWPLGWTCPSCGSWRARGSSSSTRPIRHPS